VGYSFDVFDNPIATEWSHGSVINLGGLPGSVASEALGVNDAGQAVGFSDVGGLAYATEWSHGQVIDLGPGWAYGINDAGQVVGYSDVRGGVSATEWSGGSVINLGGLPGSVASEASTTPGRQWVTAGFTPAVLRASTPPSGPAGGRSTWESCQAPQ
jgi:probable HAF family extracellular repeat protein